MILHLVVCECGCNLPAAVHNANSTISPITLIECQIQPNDYKFQWEKRAAAAAAQFCLFWLSENGNAHSAKCALIDFGLTNSFFGSEPLNSPTHWGHPFEFLISRFPTDAHAPSISSTVVSGSTSTRPHLLSGVVYSRHFKSIASMPLHLSTNA